MSDYLFSIFFADDEAAIRNGLMQAIPWDRYQARVIGAEADGLSALDFILKHQPDLAVIDIKMPGMDGIEILKKAKQAGVSTTFLILSGYNDFILAQQAIRYGAARYFLKPLKIEEFKIELTQIFSDISSRKNVDSAREHMEALLQTSRIFFLNQLLLQEIRDPQELFTRYSVLHLKLVNAPCTVCVFASDCDDDTLLSDLLPRAEQLIQDAFQSIPCEIFQRSDGSIILMLNDSDSDSLYKTLVPVLPALRQETGIRFFAGIGKRAASILKTADSYQSALRALSYHIYEKEDELYDDSIICRVEPDPRPEKTDFSPLYSAIDKNDNSGITGFCSDYFRTLFFVPMPPPDYIRGMCIFLLRHVQAHYLSKNREPFRRFELDTERIRTLHSIPVLFEWLLESLRQICESYTDQGLRRDPVIAKAADYVNQHLDYNIKAGEIAALVNFSESYFTIYFKNKTGQNFRDYVLNARIEYAKKLLTEGRYTVKEIAEKTGYQDYRSFSRAFKNITGTAPSDYQTS